MQNLPIELYRAAQVRELDRLAIEERGIPGYTLMSRAGKATFDALRRQWPQARRIAVLCGGGNNGGDGYVVAALATQNGLDVQVWTLSDPERLRGDALTAFRDAQAAGVAIAAFTGPTDLDAADVFVDALFGTGLERKVGGLWREAIKAMNRHSAPVMAVDIPSGLHADTGAVMGVAVRADLTVTFIGLKQGLFTGQGPACCGRVLYDDLHVPEDVHSIIHPASRRYDGGDLPTLLPKRSRSAHKGNHGHVLVVGGDLGMGGAARMAAEAAARCGAGLVSVATRAAHASMQAAVRPELMFRGVESMAELAPLLARASVVAVGPGLRDGDWGKSLLQAVLASDRPLVVDADGLNLLAAAPLRRDNWVLTPHPGEAARLLQTTPGEVEADRFTAVAEIALRFGGVCVLKGAGSLIADERDGLWLCNAGNPGMASGGMGDVLTGVIAGLLAQGLSPIQAARVGVYLHGRAGDRAAQDGERGLLAMDLLPHLRTLVNP
ncbi:MAG: NAD(P)H-hydrate dehydratase [Gammaproteobacteria bacterium]|nr:NAD(P)H-hydrate dehydratase [Gammaproteobacteria bacterium]MCP5459127.1 NAD(P)H-hydrate dehydratase [Gammaproteobacteria bacterium]